MRLCRLRAIFRLLANNTEITAIAKYHVVVNYMREHAINCFYHEQYFTNILHRFVRAASFFIPRHGYSICYHDKF